MICHSLLSHAQSAKHSWLLLWHCPLLFCSWKTLVGSGSECLNSLLPVLSFIFICYIEWHLLWKLKGRSQWRWIVLKLKCSCIRFLERWHLSQEEKETLSALCISREWMWQAEEAATVQPLSYMFGGSAINTVWTKKKETKDGTSKYWVYCEGKFRKEATLNTDPSPRQINWLEL